MKSIQKILQEFEAIPSNDKLSACLWYHEAHNFAKAVSKRHNIPLSKVCGVISALSPSNEWTNNKLEADKLIKAYVNDENYVVIKFRTYGNNVSKAIKILDLDNNQFDLVKTISKILLGTSGHKTQNFFHNILDPDSKEYVTIDRHMLTFLKESKVKSKKHYYDMAERVKKTANKIGLVPSVLQAILWEHQIRMNSKL